MAIVAVVGRPNVGKSSLFNKIVNQRLSIVEDTPGVTRDRIYCDTEWNGVKFTLVGRYRAANQRRYSFADARAGTGGDR